MQACGSHEDTMPVVMQVAGEKRMLEEERAEVQTMLQKAEGDVKKACISD